MGMDYKMIDELALENDTLLFSFHSTSILKDLLIAIHGSLPGLLLIILPLPLSFSFNLLLLLIHEEFLRSGPITQQQYQNVFINQIAYDLQIWLQ